MKLQEKPKATWQVDVECALCHDVIYSRYDGEYRKCKCGAIAVDQTPFYARYIGDRTNFIFYRNKTN